MLSKLIKNFIQKPIKINTLELDRPIFIVGHARAGSTALAAIINWHSHIGSAAPKPNLKYAGITEFLDAIRHHNSHLTYSEQLEQKDTWFRYFPGENIFTHMGKELIVEKLNLNVFEINKLKKELTRNFRGKRFLSKAPTNSFRIRILRHLFPDAKIIALYRKGPAVIASWGQRDYGFGKPVHWGTTRFEQLPYQDGIRIFARKWLEVIQYLESQKKEIGFYSLGYERLIQNPLRELTRLFEYLEIPVESYISKITLANKNKRWQEVIPQVYHELVLKETAEGQKILNDQFKADLSTI